MSQSEDWERIEPLLDRAMDLLGAERDQFLEDLARREPELYVRVVQLLDAAGLSASLIIDQPLAEAASDLVDRVPLDHWDAGLGAGDQVGPYRIVRPLGGGGMGHVFVAELLDDESDSASAAQEGRRTLGEQVALKVLSRSRDKEEMRRRFQREREILASFDHPLIVPLRADGITRDGRPYFAMRLLDGVSLTKYCREHKLGLEERIRLFLEVCDAVAYAHARGVIHRDLKPSNVLVEADHAGGVHPYVLDFGIAHEGEARDLTLTGQIMGTPGYMSPEQARGEIDRIDRRSDVFSLGAMLFELLSGERAYRGKNPAETLIAVVETEAPRLRDVAADLPEDLEWIVGRCLARDRSQRYESVRDLQRDLLAYLAAEPLPSRRVTEQVARSRAELASEASAGWWSRDGRGSRGARGLALAATVFALLVLAVVAWWQLRASNRSESAAEHEVAEVRDRAEVAREVVSRARFAHLAQLHDLRPTKRQIAPLRLQLVHGTNTAADPASQAALGRVEWSLRRTREAAELLRTSLGAAAYRADPETRIDALATWTHHCLDQVEQARWIARSAVAGVSVATSASAPELKDGPRLVFDDCRRRVAPLLAPTEDVDSGGVDRSLAEQLEMYEAFWSGELERAVELGRRITQTQPWLFEAQTALGTFLLLDLSSSATGSTTDAADFDEHAARQLALAASAFERAAQQGRSDPMAHQRLCQARWWSSQAASPGSAAAARSLSSAREACEAARAADTDRAWPALLLGSIRRAETTARSSEVSDPCGPAATVARQAALLDDGGSAPHLLLGLHCLEESGDQATATLEQARRALDEAARRAHAQTHWQGAMLAGLLDELNQRI